LSIDAEQEHGAVLLEALRVFQERNAVYKDNWKVSGWRGNLFKLRLKVERAWAVLWDAPPYPISDLDVDDLLDVINYAACTIRCIRDGNRGGSWWPDEET
jgi:hypothetical protein